MSDWVVQVCGSADFDAVAGTCSAPLWVPYSSGFFSGWTSADIAALVGALLTVAAVAYIIRIVHRFALDL